jgi:hypothetical protein
MDWALSFATELANCGLGWSKGKWWMWLINAAVSGWWILYAISIKQFGLILSAVVMIILDLVSAYKAKK